MQKLNQNELQGIQGGIGFWTGVGIVGIGIFIVGILDGFTRPIRCN